jgi:hypothetical protein
METLALGGIEYGLDRTGDAGLLREARQATRRKSVKGVADRLDATADVLSNLGWGVVLRTGQDNLAPTQRKRLLGAQPTFKVAALLIGQRANKNRRFHGREPDTGTSFCTRPLLRLH